MCGVNNISTEYHRQWFEAMLPRCAWPHATLRYPWACAQQLFAISTSSSCGAARFSESRQDDCDEGTEGRALMFFAGNGMH